MAFIALEGVEGCGKSTQSSLLTERLNANGIEAVLTREPGGTAQGQKIRELLLDPSRELSPRAEALLYAADRAEHVAEVVRPALESGRWVVCDRFSDSYRAYQGAGRGLDGIGPISTWASCGLEPDLVIVLDLPVELGMKRIGGSFDRIESAGIDFHIRVRQAFLDLAAAEPERFSVIDATDSVERVAELIWDAVHALSDADRAHSEGGGR
ncbi:MAG: dTMP kinase [Acidobacteria bacterium]|nr:MAG: dTMP kinase [Acidobacteriota bacterium]